MTSRPPSLMSSVAPALWGLNICPVGGVAVKVEHALADVQKQKNKKRNRRPLSP